MDREDPISYGYIRWPFLPRASDPPPADGVVMVSAAHVVPPAARSTPPAPWPPARRRSLAGWVGILLVALVGLGGIAGLPHAALAGYASLVVDAGTGKVLYARNADTRNYPASLTKMMTLYLLFDAIDSGKYSMTSRLPVSAHAAGQPPSKLGVQAGQTIAVQDAIRALVTKSANDVAVVVAEALGGTEAGFARKMTDTAHRLGMSRTTFRNASGLPDPGQMSTAHDMALLGMALLKHFPHHYHYFSTRSFRYGTRTVTTHNHLLGKYTGADGMKTGYIRASGFNIVTSAVRDGRRLVGVVFGGRTAQSRDAHMMELLDQGFAEAEHLGDPAPPPAPKPALIAALTGATAGSTPRVFDMGSADDAPPPPPAKPHPDGSGPLLAQAIIQTEDDTAGDGSATLSGGGAPLTDGAADQPAPQLAMLSSPPQPQGPPTLPAGAWGVQVGAFGSAPSATSAVEQAVARLEPHVSQTLIGKVLPHQASTGTLYRARVVGLKDEASARAACDVLVRDRRGCLIVLPSGSSMVFR